MNEYIRNVVIEHLREQQIKHQKAQQIKHQKEHLEVFPPPATLKDIDILKWIAKKVLKSLMAAGIHAKLADVHQVAAKSLGYNSWQALVATIEKRNKISSVVVLKKPHLST